MADSEHDVPVHFDVAMDADGECRLRLAGRLDITTVSGIQQEVTAAVETRRPSRLRLDLEGVTYLDDFGALLLSRLRDNVVNQGGTVELLKVPGHVGQMLSLVNFNEADSCRATFEQRQAGAVSRLGDATLTLFFNIRYLVSFLGSVLLAFGYAIAHPRSLRWNDTVS